TKNAMKGGERLMALLDVRNISVDFQTSGHNIQALQDISFQVKPGETVCIVGESGSGKSVTSLALMGVVEYESGKISHGEFIFDGEDRTRISQEELCHIRGEYMSIIFQEPMTALNPVFTIGRQLTEGLRQHQKVSKKEAWDKACE